MAFFKFLRVSLCRYSYVYKINYKVSWKSNLSSHSGRKHFYLQWHKGSIDSLNPISMQFNITSDFEALLYWQVNLSGNVSLNIHLNQDYMMIIRKFICNCYFIIVFNNYLSNFDIFSPSSVKHYWQTHAKCEESLLKSWCRLSTTILRLSSGLIWIVTV